MTIRSVDLVFRPSLSISDTAAQNGGKMGTALLETGIRNNVWPNVPQAERASGSNKFRKVFLHIITRDNLSLIAPRLFLTTPTPAQDRMLICLGDKDDFASGTIVTSAVSGHTFYGAGTLKTPVSSGATSLEVTVEDATDTIFKNGRLVRIFTPDAEDSLTGTSEYVRITAAPTYNGNDATLTVEALTSSYVAPTTYVSSVIEASDTTSSISLPAKAGSGTFTIPSTNLPTTTNAGAVDQTWTISFTSATAFNCTALAPLTGTVGTGTVSSDFSPMNSTTGAAYFTIPRLFWGTGLAIGTVITFSTVSATLPIWFYRIIPPNAASLSGNKAVLGIEGESE